MNYYQYTYANGDTEFYRVDADGKVLIVRTGKIECIGVGSGPSAEWLAINAKDATATIFNAVYTRVLVRIQIVRG
jgi:hypothetical protein